MPPAPSGVTSLETMKELRSFLDNHPFAVVDFYATWCGPCMAVKGAYAALSRKYPSVGLAQVNVEEGEEIAEKYRIDSLPTFICFSKGEKVRCIKGADIAAVEGAVKGHVGKVTTAASTSSGDKKRDARKESAKVPKKSDSIKKKKASQH